MIETIVSLETAKLLKEKEFSVNTNAYKDCLTYEEALEEGLKQALKLI